MKDNAVGKNGNSLTIDLGDSYTFKAFGNSVPLQPNPKVRGSVAASYLAYANNYYKLAFDYTKYLDFLLKEQSKIFKKYRSLGEASKNMDYNRAHMNVAHEIYKLPSIFTNACLAVELTFKALIAHEEGLEDIDKANTMLKQEYSHDLIKLSNSTKAQLDLTEKELILIRNLNIMYSGAKKFQYPHSFQAGVVKEIPEIQQVVAFASRLLRSVTEKTSK